MKILNTMLGRQAIAAALVLSLAIPMSVGAFAEEPAAAAATDDTVVAGYLPPQDESVMLQGEIALHSGDAAVGETDPAYGGYGAPEGDPIQGDIMLISADEAKTTEARYTVKGLLGRQVLYTARQEGRVLTLDVPDCAATFRTTIQDMKTLMEQGVSTLVLTTEKGSTTLNLSLLCEGQTDTQRVVLRQLGDSAFLDGRPALPPRPHRGPLSGVCSPFLKLNRNTAGALCRYDPVGRSCRVWEISEDVKFYCAFCLRSCAFFQARSTLILVTMLSG